MIEPFIVIACDMHDSNNRRISLDRQPPDEKIYSYRRRLSDSQPLCPTMVPPPRALACSMPGTSPANANAYDNHSHSASAGRHDGGGWQPGAGGSPSRGFSRIARTHARPVFACSGSNVSPTGYSGVTHRGFAEEGGSCSPAGFRRLTLDNAPRPAYNPTHD